jgi:menaquinol-cytochrome c reductase iron-sulfur subunit
MADPSTGPDAAEVSRRGFVGWAVGLGAGFIGVVLGLPLLALFRGTNTAAVGPFVEVTDVGSLPLGEPAPLTFVEEDTDAYVHQILPHSVWAVKKSETEVVVYSPVCPHLGCQVYWNARTKQYDCPCHGSVFAPDGHVLAGPAPRALDTLPVKIEKGQLYVQWVQYKPGLPDKVPV